MSDVEAVMDRLQPESADANDYLCQLCDAMIVECRANYGRFLQVFADAALMDFYNNNAGRNYANTYGTTYTNYNMYVKAKNNAAIITTTNNVAGYRYSIHGNTS